MTALIARPADGKRPYGASTGYIYDRRVWAWLVRNMNSKDLQKRGFSEPVDLTEGGQLRVPATIGVYVIIRKGKEIGYPMGTSDIVKVGKCEEIGKGFNGKCAQFFSPTPSQQASKGSKQDIPCDLHAFSWLEVPKSQIKQVERRLLNEFVRFHGQYPAYNLTHK